MCKRPRPPRAHATGGPRSGGAGPTGRTATPGRGSVLAGSEVSSRLPGHVCPPWAEPLPGRAGDPAERPSPVPPVGARGPGLGRVLSVFAVLSGTSVPAGKGGSSVTGRGGRPSSAAPWSGRRLTLQALCRRLHAGAARSLPTRASCVPRGPAWDPSLCGSRVPVARSRQCAAVTKLLTRGAGSPPGDAALWRRCHRFTPTPRLCTGSAPGASRVRAGVLGSQGEGSGTPHTGLPHPRPPSTKTTHQTLRPDVPRHPQVLTQRDSPSFMPVPARRCELGSSRCRLPSRAH